MTILTLTTDFGLEDYYVGAVKGTVLRLTADLPRFPELVDLSHDVGPQDVEGALHLLAAAAPTFPAGTVHLAVVDPGVGTTRRILAVESGEYRFVAPDNGLLTPFLRREDARAFAVDAHGLFLDAPGATFHGRDRFAPTAAALLRGAAPGELGSEVDDPVLLDLPEPRRVGDRLEGRVIRIDRFGNLITNLPAEEIPQGAAVHVAGRRVTRRVRFYAELPSGEPGWLIGSRGTLELSLAEDDLARHWKVGRGETVEVVTEPSST